MTTVTVTVTVSLFDTCFGFDHSKWNVIIRPVSKFGCLVSRSMLNCVNALDQRLPASERAALMVAEEKPLPDSCKHPSYQAGRGTCPDRPWLTARCLWEMTASLCEAKINVRGMSMDPRFFENKGALRKPSRSSLKFLSLLLVGCLQGCVVHVPITSWRADPARMYPEFILILRANVKAHDTETHTPTQSPYICIAGNPLGDFKLLAVQFDYSWSFPAVFSALYKAGLPFLRAVLSILLIVYCFLNLSEKVSCLNFLTGVWNW